MCKKYFIFYSKRNDVSFSIQCWVLSGLRKEPISEGTPE